MKQVIDQFGPLFRAIPFWTTVAFIGVVEVASYAGSVFPGVNIAAFISLVVITFVYALRDLRYGVLILLAELCIGSKGYLFSLPVGDFELSLRLGLFLAVFAAYAYWLVRDRQIRFFRWLFWPEFSLVIGLVGVGVVVGLLRQNELANIFFDANGYLYLALAGPMTQAIRTQDHLRQVFAVLFASVVALGIKTLVLLGLFSQLQLLQYTLPGLYRWVRDTGVGEITRFDSGFSRIFFQSHIFLVITLFLVAPAFARVKSLSASLKSRPAWGAYGLLLLSMMVIFLSYSRSFWVATAAGLIVLALWLWLREKLSLRRLVLWTGFLGISFGFAYGVSFAIVNIPLPGHVGIGADTLLTDRTQDFATEPAAASRWQSLDPLMQAALENPLLGSGLGTTVTYISDDPRVRANSPSGAYETYAFEWGYLDIFLKFGVIGLILMGFLLLQILRQLLWRRETVANRTWHEGTAFALLALALTHIFTPYLNHPLGIGWLLIAALVVALPKTEAKPDVK